MSPLTAGRHDHVYAFDGFTLDPCRRLLVRGNEDVPLGSRALDLLIALIEQAGDILSRDHLTARVWPRTIVEDSSLRVHMAALRRTLGDGQSGRRYIATIPGRGYSFVAEVARRARDVSVPAPPSPGRLLGREKAMAALAQLLQGHRLVTLVGPGGVGKTALALHRASSHAQPVRIVDLASATDHADLTQRLAATVSGIGGAPCLLIIDGCEHLIDPVARAVEALLAKPSELRLLTTSREPLNVRGEQVLRLDTLALPAGQPASLVEALQAPAVRLLVERARASGSDVAFDDADAAALCELARQLDGLPLALELGAARVRALGLKGMLDRLDDLDALLNRGRRTALPRHRSLDANIGWSYDLLDNAERTVLRALAVFPGSFTLANAVAVVAMPAGRSGAVEEQVLRLVEKSLVLAVPKPVRTGSADNCTVYRLPNTTRRYAASKLRSHGDELEAAMERALALGAAGAQPNHRRSAESAVQ